MQSEAGQGLAHIVARKEAERRAGKGIFFWGVGNPPAVAAAALARMKATVPLYFSVMKSKPKVHDVAPARVVAWRRFHDSEGIIRELPAHVLVTSRASTRGCHYALICYSEEPLGLGNLGSFDTADWRNFGGTGAQIGSSQVTALLRRIACSGSGDYRIAMKAHLTGGYWVKLVDPVEVSIGDRGGLNDDAADPLAWVNLAMRIKGSFDTCERKLPGHHHSQYGLFTV